MEDKKSDFTSDRISILIAEYNALIKEQHLRMDHRLRFIAFNILASGALMTIAFERDKYIILLIVPLMSSLFGMLMAYHSRAVQDISNHIKSEIASRINTLIGEQLPTWDVKPAPKGRIWYGIWCFHIPILASIILPAVLCLVIFSMDDNACWTLGGVLLFIIDFMIILYCGAIYGFLVLAGKLRRDSNLDVPTRKNEKK